jgi:ribosomal protein S6
MEQRNYELTFLASPELKTEELESLIEKVKGLATSNPNVTKIIPPKKIKLSYPIKKQVFANIITLEMSLSPEEAQQTKEKLDKEERILRYLLIKIKKQPEKKQKKEAETAKLNKVEEKKEALQEEEKEKEKEKVELEKVEEKLKEIV